MEAMEASDDDEHAHLALHIQALRELADQVGETPVESLRQDIDGAYRFLTHHLIPHAEVEDQLPYPIVGKALTPILAPGAWTPSDGCC